MRVAIDPDRLAALGLTLEDIRNAVAAATVDKPKGTLEGPSRSIVLRATDQLTLPSQYGDVVVAAKGGRLTIDFTPTPVFKSGLETWGTDAFRTRFPKDAGEDAIEWSPL